MLEELLMVQCGVVQFMHHSNSCIALVLGAVSGTLLLNKAERWEVQHVSAIEITAALVEQPKNPRAAVDEFATLKTVVLQVAEERTRHVP